MSKFLLMMAPTAMLLAGCASVEGEFPSLAKRPYEDADPLAEPVVTSEPVATVMPGALQSKVGSLLSRARTAQAAFETALPVAASAAQSAAGASVGSEVWVNAHMLLSRADSMRADAVAALGEIDRLIAGERERGADAGLVSLLSVQQNGIATLVNAQTAEIERLTKLIGV